MLKSTFAAIFAIWKHLSDVNGKIILASGHAACSQPVYTLQSVHYHDYFYVKIFSYLEIFLFWQYFVYFCQ